MNAPSPDDDARDAHLLAALRHAPDRDALPPAPLTAAILDQARQAVRPSRPAARAWREGLSAAFARLWQPAPMAAFGTLAMATLIGVMWGGQPVPDATPELRPEQAVPAPQQARDAAAAVGSMAAVPASRDVSSGTKEAAPDVAPSSPAVPKATAKAKPSAPAAPPPPEAAATRAEAMQERDVRRDTADAAAPQAAAAPAPAPAPLQSGTLTKSMADAAPVKQGGRGAATPSAPMAAPVEAPALRSRREASAQLGGVPQAQPTDPFAGVASMLARGDATSALWQVPGLPTRSVPHGDAQRAWWDSVNVVTQGHWQSVVPPTQPLTPWLVLTTQGRTLGIFWPDGDGLMWADRVGRTWRAPVARAKLLEWQEAVTRW